MAGLEKMLVVGTAHRGSQDKSVRCRKTPSSPCPQTIGTHPSRADHSRQMPWKWLGTALDQAGHPTPHHTVNAPILGSGQKHEMVATGKRAQGKGGFQRESHIDPTLSLLHTGYTTHITSLPRHARVHAHACMCLSNTRTHTPPEHYQPGHREGIKDRQGQCQ